MSRSVLVVDDNAVDRSRMEKLMSDAGYMVTLAVNGAQAIELAKRIKPSLILMDVNMPEMDGFAATEYIRRAGSDVMNGNAVIIAMTAHAVKGDREKCISAGMDDYISKPISIEKLSQILDKWQI